MRGRPAAARLPVRSREGRRPNVAIFRMAQANNRAYAAQGLEPTGRTTRKASAPRAGTKTPGCNGGGWTGCGSNTYPAGLSRRATARWGSTI